MNFRRRSQCVKYSKFEGFSRAVATSISDTGKFSKKHHQGTKSLAYFGDFFLGGAYFVGVGFFFKTPMLL